MRYRQDSWLSERRGVQPHAVGGSRSDGMQGGKGARTAEGRERSFREWWNAIPTALMGGGRG